MQDISQLFAILSMLHIMQANTSWNKVFE